MIYIGEIYHECEVENAFSGDQKLSGYVRNFQREAWENRKSQNVSWSLENTKTTETIYSGLAYCPHCGESLPHTILANPQPAI